MEFSTTTAISTNPTRLGLLDRICKLNRCQDFRWSKSMKNNARQHFSRELAATEAEASILKFTSALLELRTVTHEIIIWTIVWSRLRTILHEMNKKEFKSEIIFFNENEWLMNDKNCTNKWKIYANYGFCSFLVCEFARSDFYFSFAASTLIVCMWDE